MLSIGWTEMMLIAAIALIVVGPKDLPAMLQQVGKFAGQIRRMGNEFKSEINKAVAVDEIKDLKKSVAAPLADVKREIQKEFNSIGSDGAVKPSGALKPADPKVEDVTTEIRKAAGMTDTADGSKSKAVSKAKPAVKSKTAPKASGAKKPTAKPRAAKKPAAKKTPAKKPAVRATRTRRNTTNSDVDGAAT